MTHFVSLPHAQTSHGDLTGSISADLEDGAESLARLAGLGGIDLSRYQPVGLCLVRSMPEVSVYFYCLDRQRLEGFALEHGGKLPVIRLQSSLSLERVFEEFAELEIQVFDHSKALEHFSWVEDDPERL